MIDANQTRQIMQSRILSSDIEDCKVETEPLGEGKVQIRIFSDNSQTQKVVLTMVPKTWEIESVGFYKNCVQFVVYEIVPYQEMYAVIKRYEGGSLLVHIGEGYSIQLPDSFFPDIKEGQVFKLTLAVTSKIQ